MGFDYINDAQKIRISISDYARTIIADDMRFFLFDKESSFINIIIENFRSSAKASLSQYLDNVRLDYEKLFEDAQLDDATKDSIISHMLKEKRQKLEADVIDFSKKESSKNKLYHINNNNSDYLRNDCEDNKFYNDKAGRYLKCILEEYAQLSFIEREHIIKKEVYDKIYIALSKQCCLEISCPLSDGTIKKFTVYPYKIIADSFHTQEYLACFTTGKGESSKGKEDASFSIARLNSENIKIMEKQKCFISTEEKKKIEKDIKECSIAYLLGEPVEIKVRLTTIGKQIYNSRLFGRPAVSSIDAADTYTFNCTENQAFHFFLSFGAEAYIVSPVSLRERILQFYKESYEEYEKK